MKKLDNHFQLYINGEWRSGSTNQIMHSQNPHNNQTWASFDCASEKDIDLAVQSAKDALNNQSWKSMTASNRGKLLFRLADLIENNADNIGNIEAQDSGKLLAETVSQTKYVSEYYRYFAGMADKIEGSTLPIDKQNMHVYTTHHPIGVVAAIVPWNAQMFLTATKLAPALAAGCSVIIKASEIAPCSLFELAKLIDQAGFPKGVVSIVTGDSDNCAIPLTSHPGIDRIAFTGGTETAKKIIKNSANNFAATNLELGGKSPLVIFDDADIESAANGIIAGNFGASGQSCVAGSRVIVQKNISSNLKDLIKQKSENIIVGNPLDPKTNLGPLCTSKQIEVIENTKDKIDTYISNYKKNREKEKKKLEKKRKLDKKKKEEKKKKKAKKKKKKKIRLTQDEALILHIPLLLRFSFSFSLSLLLLVALFELSRFKKRRRRREEENTLSERLFGAF